MDRSKYILKNSLLFIGIILLTQVLVYVLDANWSFFMTTSADMDHYFHINYIDQLRFNLWFAYGIFLVFKVISTVRTFKLNPIYIVPEGAKVKPIKTHRYAGLVYVLIMGLLTFTYLRSSDKSLFYLSMISSMITALVPLGLFFNSSVFLYNDRVKIKDKIYMGYDFSDVLEDEDEDSTLVSFQFKHINNHYKLSVPIEHRNALHTQLLHFVKINKPRLDEM